MARVCHRWQFGHPSTSDHHQEELYKPDCWPENRNAILVARAEGLLGIPEPRCPVLALLGAGGSLRPRRRVSAMAGVEDKVMVSRSWPSLFRSEGILAPRVLPWRASPIRRWYRSNLIRGSLLSTSGPGSAESQHAELCRASLVCSSSSLFAVCSILEDNARKATSLANQTWIFESASASPKLGIPLRLSL